MSTSAEQLNEAIAALNGAAEAYNGKKAEIDAALAVALASVISMERTHYVHQITGDDNAAGDINAPLASIQEALNRTPFGGKCSIRLLADYTLPGPVFADGLKVRIEGHDGVRHTLSFGYYQVNNVDNLAHFDMRFGCDMNIDYLDVAFPAVEPQNTLHSFFTAMFQMRSYAAQGLQAFRMREVDFLHRGRTDLQIFKSNAAAYSAMFDGCTFESGFEGKVFAGYGGVGFDVATLPRWIVTDLDFA